MKTMQNRKMSLEPLQILRQLYQYYLFDKDQQQVRKDQLQVLILVMTTVSTAMRTVHRVKTQEEQYPIQIYLFYLTNDENLTMTLEIHMYAAVAGSFCFITTVNGDQQDICNLTTMPSVQRSLYLNEMTKNFSNIQVEVPTGVDGRTRDVLEECMTTCGKAAGIQAKRRSRARKEASAKGTKRILQTIC